MKRFMEMVYWHATCPEDLLWYSATPPKLLAQAVQQRKTTGRALDVGCGAGTYSAYLARQGYDVTGVDFVSKAIQLAERTARAENVKVKWVHADLLDWKPDARFDVILDSGTLHTIASKDIPRYKSQLLRWLAPEGDYILCHWGKRHAFDWRPFGPNRRTRREIVGAFAPELREKTYEHEIGTRIPFPIGPKVLVQSFWFQRERESGAPSGTMLTDAESRRRVTALQQ